MDPLGTILFIVVGFGWGKPVPIDPRYFKHVNRDSAIVAAAGPFSNLILAWLFGGILVALGANMGPSIGSLVQSSAANSATMQFAIEVCTTSVYINLILMAFNLLPIAPLDGSKILRLVIPYQYEDVYNDFMTRGPMILLGLLILDRVLPIPLLSSWIFIIINPIIALMSAVMNAI